MQSQCIPVFCVALTMLTACESTMEDVKTLPLETNTNGDGLIAYPAEIRGAYIRSAENIVSAKQYVPKYDDKGKVVGFELQDVTYINPKQIICAEPPPDTSVSSTAAFNASANLQLTQSLTAVTALTNTLAQTISNQASQSRTVESNSSTGNSGSSSTMNASLVASSNAGYTDTSNDVISLAGNISRTANELSGRDNIVLLSREMFFRNCEAFANGAISRDTYGQLHRESVSQITAMLDTQKALANAVEANSKAKQAEADAKKAEAEKLLIEATNNTTSLIKQSNLLNCGKEFASCKEEAAGNNEKIKVCEAKQKVCVAKQLGGKDE